MKITVVGLGYVGMSNAVLLSQQHEVTALDICPRKIRLIKMKLSPIGDTLIDEYLQTKSLNLNPTIDRDLAYSGAEYVIIATPTDYNPETNSFDTRSIEAVVDDVIRLNSTATIIIKSTIPVGYTDKLAESYSTDRIIFSPEFLREGTALYDNLYPNRIVIGSNSSKAKKFARALVECSQRSDTPILYTNNTEAEAIKLFSNAYLAMRISFFNELDSYAMINGLNTAQIISGVCLDKRIGLGYNNPSFGYGGYCFPKDTKQLLANYKNVPQNLIGAIVASNTTRKQLIADSILARKPKIVGVYRLTMKSGSDNFRSSAVQDIIENLSRAGVEIVVYEPDLNKECFMKHKVINDLNEFKSICDVIVANRGSSDLDDVIDKVITRDVFGGDN